jgi:ABC-2 type transport system permease protein
MVAVFTLMLRTLLSRGRVAALVAVGLIGIVIGVAVGSASSSGVDRVTAAFHFVDGFGLGLLVPITALVAASSAFGDPVEDGTLVYLWLRPIARWQLTAAALAASVCVAVPFALVPAVIAASATRTGSGLPLGVLVAGSVATVAYCTLFLGLGLVVRRALVWGLAYVLIWEGFVARSGTAAARLSILVYARSLMASVADFERPRLASSVPVAVVVPLAIGACAVALTSWALRRVDVR